MAYTPSPIDPTKHSIVTVLSDVPDRIWTKLAGAPEEWGTGVDTYQCIKTDDFLYFVRKNCHFTDTKPSCLAAVNMYIVSDGHPIQTTMPGLTTPDKSLIFVPRKGVDGASMPTFFPFAIPSGGALHDGKNGKNDEKPKAPWLISATLDVCDDLWRVLSVKRDEWGVQSDVYQMDMSSDDTRAFFKISPDGPLSKGGCVIFTSSEGFGDDITFSLPAVMTPDKSHFLIHRNVITI